MTARDGHWKKPLTNGAKSRIYLLMLVGLLAISLFAIHDRRTTLQKLPKQTDVVQTKRLLYRQYVNPQPEIPIVYARSL